MINPACGYGKEKYEGDRSTRLGAMAPEGKAGLAVSGKTEKKKGKKKKRSRKKQGTCKNPLLILFSRGSRRRDSSPRIFEVEAFLPHYHLFQKQTRGASIQASHATRRPTEKPGETRSTREKSFISSGGQNINKRAERRTGIGGESDARARAWGGGWTRGYRKGREWGFSYLVCETRL